MSSVTVLVVSCDGYADIWPVFMKAFQTYWRDCSYEVAWQSNLQTPPWASCRHIAVGPDRSWSSSLSISLNQLTTEYVLLLLDDLFLSKQVDTAMLDKVIVEAQARRANYVSFKNAVDVNCLETDLLLPILPGVPYRVSTVCSFWKVSTLLSLLRLNESAWQFEIYGTRRSFEHDGFYISSCVSLCTINGVIRGSWTRQGLEFARNVGCSITKGKREAMSLSQRTIWGLRAVLFLVLSKMPNAFRLMLQQLVYGRNFGR